MAHVVIIARSPDGLLLSEAQTTATGAVAEGRRHASDLLKHLGSLAPKCSVECAGFMFHISQNDGVCYLAMFDRSYPRNFAFAFLEEMQTLFHEELMRTFGTGSVNHRSQIDTIEKPYYFVKLDRQILKKVTQYRDPASSQALNRLHAQLTQVSGIMQHNIDEILSRGENLENVSRKAQHLSYASQDLKVTAKQLAVQALVKKFGALVMLAFIFVGLYFISQRTTSTLLVLCLSVLMCTCFVLLRSQRRRSSKAKSHDRCHFAEEFLYDSFA